MNRRAQNVRRTLRRWPCAILNLPVTCARHLTQSNGRYFERLRQMTPAERLAAGMALCNAGYAQQRAGVVRQHPNATENEILYYLARARYGPELAAKVYGHKT